MMDRVTEDIKNAMKAKDKGRLDALRMLKSALIENKTSPKPKDESDVAISHVKKLKDSLEAFPPESEPAMRIKSEIECLSPYLPQPMSQSEFEELVKKVRDENPGADFGSLMKVISPQIKGRFDGKEASQFVKSITA